MSVWVMAMSCDKLDSEAFARRQARRSLSLRAARAGRQVDGWDAIAAAGLLDRHTPPEVVTEGEVAAYNAPFPDQRYKAGVRRFPQMVMVSPEMEGADVSRQAATWWSQSWSGPTFMAVGMKDPVLGPDVMANLRQTIRGCPAPLEIPEGGHFVQEWGEDIARAALASHG